MALQQKTTQEISDNLIAQLETTLNQTIPLLPKSFLRVLSKALAGVFVLLYKYAGWMFLQIFVSTASNADTEINGKIINPLKEWGRLIGIGDPVPATRAELQIDIFVTDQTGTLPAGTPLINSNNGVTYLLLTSLSLNAPIISGFVRASADQSGGGGGGEIGNLDPGAELSFINPIANVNDIAVVTAQVVTGSDGETTEQYRQRILDRFQKQPQGGSYADYEMWAEEVAGIINAYPYTGQPGEVDVYSESGTEPDGIPTAAQLQEVKDHIDFVRPINAFVNSLPISRTSFDVDIVGLITPNQTQVIADITTELTKYFLAAEPFIVGLSILPRKDRISAGSVSGIVADVVFADGGVYNNAVVKTGGLPVDLYALGEGEKAKLGTVAAV